MRLEGSEKRILKVCRLSGPEPRKCVLVADKKTHVEGFQIFRPRLPQNAFSALPLQKPWRAEGRAEGNHFKGSHDTLILHNPHMAKIETLLLQALLENNLALYTPITLLGNAFLEGPETHPQIYFLEMRSGGPWKHRPNAPLVL